jgi:hypothetical protein
MSEPDSLATRLAQAEVKIEELRAAEMTANDTTKRATTAAATEATARDATQTASQEKTTLEVKVAELEQDLVTAGLTSGLSIDSSPRCPIGFRWSRTRRPSSGRTTQSCHWTSIVRPDAYDNNFLTFYLSLPVLTLLLAVSGLCAYRVRMTMKFTEKTQELNAALLKIIEKDISIERLTEQLVSGILPGYPCKEG